MKSNINSISSFYGESDTKRHGFTLARPETENETYIRLATANEDDLRKLGEYDHARRAGEIEYSPKEPY